MSWSTEVRIGELRPWPDAVRVVRGKTEETRRYVPERTAYRHVKSNGEYGSCKCSTCDADIHANDAFCRMCGAQLTHTEYEMEGDES